MSNVYDFKTGELIPQKEEPLGKVFEELLMLVGAMDVQGFAMYIQTGSMGSFTALKGKNPQQVADEAIRTITKHARTK